MRRQLTAIGLATLVIAAASACSGDSGQEPKADESQSPNSTAADCATLVRYDGSVYEATADDVAQSNLADEVGTGTVSVCQDSGPDAAGAIFTDTSPTAEVWSVSGTDGGLAVVLTRGDQSEIRMLEPSK